VVGVPQRRATPPTPRRAPPARPTKAGTSADVRTIVEHGARRGITVIPEIELPSHVQAALAAYPRLGNDPQRPLGVWECWGVNTKTLNAETSTVEFFTDILDETMEMFPADYIHLGVDECPVDEWQRNCCG
jgi:hexosaminidase